MAGRRWLHPTELALFRNDVERGLSVSLLARRYRRHRRSVFRLKQKLQLRRLAEVVDAERQEAQIAR